MKRTFSTMMASAAILGSTMVGCSSAGLERPKLTANDTTSLAPRIEQALADKDTTQALTLAERLVGVDSQDGNARALLGRAYLANGRYISARTAFTDALTLGNRDPRTIVSLALSEAGLGNLDGARRVLADHIADVPAGDYGLAMAMAGDPREGVRALIEASQAPDATAKTRQNLAYALAMAGAWGQARLVAGQDLTGREAEARIAQWAQSFAHGGESDRVVAMIGVAPRTDDAGLPVQFALNKAPQAEPQQLASAESASQAAPVVEPAAQDEAPAPAQTSVADKAASEPAAAPAAIAAAFPQQRAESKAAVASAPSRTTLEAAFHQRAVVPASASPAHWASGFGKPATDAKASDWVVQIGAFDSEAIARDKWSRITASRSELRQYSTIHSVATLDGRTYYRLAIRGFEDHVRAAAACAALRSLGQACFVRLDDTQTTRQARADALKQSGTLAWAEPSGRGRAR